VVIGALADEPPSNSGTPGEAPAAATATREARVVPETVRSTNYFSAKPMQRQ
jgi:hypothetical protein